MYCRNCGAQIDDHVSFCPHCGSAVNGNNPSSKNVYSQVNVEEEVPVLLKIISFLIPLVGVICYVVYMDSKPNRSKACGKMALISIVISVVLYGCSSAMLMSSL